MVPNLDDPPDRDAELTPFPWSVFLGISSAGFVWPWVLMIAVDRYLNTGRLSGFFTVYTETPVLYLLLFVSQALWSAVPFVAFAVLARNIINRSSPEASADCLPQKIGVIAAGVGALGLLTWTQAFWWKEYFLSPSGSSGIAFALGLSPALALGVMPAFYWAGCRAGKYLRGVKRCLLVALVMLAVAGCATTMDSRLMSAASNGNTGAVKALLGQGAGVNARDEHGQTALYHAVWKGQIEAVNVLLAAGADVNAKNIAGGTALMGAAWTGRAEMAQALIAKGADVNAKNSVGGTALMVAVLAGHTDVAKVLLDAGADVRVRNDQGMTALALAVKSDRRDIVELLVRAGATE